MKFIDFHSRSIKRVANPFDHPELYGKFYLNVVKESLEPFFTCFDIREEYHYDYFREGFNAKVGKLYPYAWRCMSENRAWLNGLWLGHFSWIEDIEYVCWFKYNRGI